MTAARRATKLRSQLTHLQSRYEAARRLGRRKEMERLHRQMVPMNIALLKIESRRAA